jgi:hypothetical protein
MGRLYSSTHQPYKISKNILIFGSLQSLRKGKRATTMRLHSNVSRIPILEPSPRRCFSDAPIFTVSISCCGFFSIHLSSWSRSSLSLNHSFPFPSSPGNCTFSRNRHYFLSHYFPRPILKFILTCHNHTENQTTI